MSPVDEKNPPLAAIFGLSGYALTKTEAKFFSENNPLGFILFARNIKDPGQLSTLTKSLKGCLNREVPILIDQEGGRVARMRAPVWPNFPVAREQGDVAVTDLPQATKNVDQINRAIAIMIRNAGFNVNCTPVMDVSMPETHQVIGDRAFSADPKIVGALAVAVCQAHLAEGVIPVVKHLPGHGRATTDSHMDLPVVTASVEDLKKVDLAPYYDLLKHRFSQAVWGMVAHVVYTAIDPVNPATCSKAVMGLIRKDLGFDGFLLSDDINMKALDVVGDVGQRAVATLDAGCDAVLHCNGVMKEMRQVAKATPVLSPEAIRRFNASLKVS